MARKRKSKAWNKSNPLYRYLMRNKRGSRKNRRSQGGKMTKRRSGHRSSGGFGMGGGDLITSFFSGMGAAAASKRFIGAPLGSFTGAASGGALAMLKHQNILGSIVGGYVHDNIGNVGGAGAASSITTARG